MQVLWKNRMCSLNYNYNLRSLPYILFFFFLKIYFDFFFFFMLEVFKLTLTNCLNHLESCRNRRLHGCPPSLLFDHKGWILSFLPAGSQLPLAKSCQPSPWCHSQHTLSPVSLLHGTTSAHWVLSAIYMAQSTHTESCQPSPWWHSRYTLGPVSLLPDVTVDTHWVLSAFSLMAQSAHTESCQPSPWHSQHTLGPVSHLYGTVDTHWVLSAFSLMAQSTHTEPCQPSP